jgi:hypothetical protein
MIPTLHRRRRIFSSVFPLVFAALVCVVLCAPSRALAQEMAVNLAEGRVVICPAGNGIIMATLDTHNEEGSRPLHIVPLGPDREGVILGAVEWVNPESHDEPVRLDEEFPKLVSSALNTAGRPSGADAANDIESIGAAILERVRVVAEALHSKVNLAEDEPLVRIVFAGFVPGYGPEAWRFDYRVRQDNLGNGFYRTRILRPVYTQIYPPEKGQPKTLLEVRYPPEERGKDEPELLDLLQQNDSRLESSRPPGTPVAKSIEFVVEGQSHKSDAMSDIAFLKSALPAIKPPDSNINIAFVDFDRGFQWVIAPKDKVAPPPAKLKPGDPFPQQTERPTLRRKPEN